MDTTCAPPERRYSDYAGDGLAGSCVITSGLDGSITDSSPDGADGGTLLFREDFEQFTAGITFPTTEWECLQGCPGAAIEQDGTRTIGLLSGNAVSSGAYDRTLIVSKRSFGDLDFTVRLKTIQQLRQGTPPESWEVGWVIWRYQDGNRYAAVLKSNGFEVTRRSSSGTQYLFAESTPTGGFGVWHTIRIIHKGNALSISINGGAPMQIADSAPLPAGSVGIYAEEARARFDDIEIHTP